LTGAASINGATSIDLEHWRNCGCELTITAATQVRVHYGYRRVHVMLRREGHPGNVKRVYRLYREEGLSLRLKRPRRNKAAKLRQPKQLANTVLPVRIDPGTLTLTAVRTPAQAR
jgi:hypothetical protein